MDALRHLVLRDTERLQEFLDQDLAPMAALDAMDEEVKDEVRRAVEFAEQSDFPPVETMYEAVYVQQHYPFLV